MLFRKRKWPLLLLLFVEMGIGVVVRILVTNVAVTAVTDTDAVAVDVVVNDIVADVNLPVVHYLLSRNPTCP